MPARGAPQDAAGQRRRVWPWAVAAVIFALVTGLQLHRLRAGQPPQPTRTLPPVQQEGDERRGAASVVCEEGDGGGPVVRGVVRDVDGAPASGALVVCEGCLGEAEGETHRTARTDREGHFVLTLSCRYGVLVRLVALKAGRVGWGEAGRTGEDALLTLALPSTVGGRVLRPDGGAVAGVTVVFSEPLLQPMLLHAGADGRFSGEVPPGLYRVTLRPDTSRPRRVWTVPVPLDHSLELATGDVP